MQRMAHGDEPAVAEFYSAHVDAVFRFVIRRVDGRYEDAEEITQDVFVSALQLAPTYDASCSVTTWLCGIARVRLADFFDYHGRQKRIPREQLVSLDDEGVRPLPDATTDSSEEAAVSRLEAARLTQVIACALSDEEREALMLRFVDGFSIREIAVLLQRTEKAVEHLLTRARQKAARAVASQL